MDTEQSDTLPETNGAGDENALAYRSIRNVFLAEFPDLWDRIQAKYGPQYNLKTQIPGPYPLFEEILKPRVTELLQDGADEESLQHIFSFYEEMARSQDEEVVNLLWKSNAGASHIRQKTHRGSLEVYGRKNKRLGATDSQPPRLGRKPPRDRSPADTPHRLKLARNGLARRMHWRGAVFPQVEAPS